MSEHPFDAVPHADARRGLIPFHQTQISTEVIDDEYKYGLPRRGSPFKGLAAWLLIRCLSDLFLHLLGLPERRLPEVLACDERFHGGENLPFKLFA